MRYSLFVLVLIGCGGSNHPAWVVADGGMDAQAAGGGNSPDGLLGAADRDGASATEDDAGSVMPDLDAAVVTAGDAAVLDGAAGLDATIPEPPMPGTTCDPCTTAADCAGGYGCVYRDVDVGRACFPQFPQYATGCSTFAPGLYSTTSQTTLITTCYPSKNGTSFTPPGRDCVSWRAIYLP